MFSRQNSFLSKLPEALCHRGMQIEGGEKRHLPSTLWGSCGWSICKSSGIHLWVSISSFPHWTLAGLPFNLKLFPNGAIYPRTELVCSKAMLTSIMISCALLSMLALRVKTKGILRTRKTWDNCSYAWKRNGNNVTKFQLHFKHHILWVYSTVRLDINKHDYDKIIIDH